MIESYGIGTGTFSLSGYVGGFQQWQQSPNGSSSWVAADGSNNAYSYSFSNKPVGDLYYRGLVTNFACVNTPTQVVHLAVYNVPSINVAGSPITKFELALGNTVTLQSANTHYAYKWLRNDTLISTTSTFLVDRPAQYKLSVQANATAPWATTGALVISPLGLQSSVSNNISVTTAIRKAGVKPTTNLYTSSLQSTDYRQAISYTDALGRPYQSIAIGQSPAGKDIVQPFAYDSIRSISYMPYISSNRDGQVRDSALTAHLNGKKNYMGSEHRNFYIQASAKIDTSTFAYARDSMENSPLRRVIRHGAPGKDFQIRNSGHYVKPEFHINTVGDSVRIWTISGPTGFYSANALAVSKLKDENDNLVYTYTDKMGRTILKRVQTGTSTSLRTYYVYDIRGNLVMQVPPKASAKAGAWTTAIRDQYCFQYTYDVRNRLVEKLVPGAPAPVYYVYDPLGRLILTQDGKLRASKKWAFIKYDMQNRPVMTGLYTNTTYTTRPTVQANVADILYSSGPWYEERGTALHGYTNQSFPTTNAPSGAIEVLTVAYYDNYDFDYDGNADCNYTTQWVTGEQAQGNSFGLPTGSKRLILGTSTWLYNYQFYDRFGRTIQTRSNNHLSPTVNNLSTVGYDFEGKVLQTKTRHYGGGTNTTLTITRNEYDFAGRLVRVYHSTDSAQEIVSAYYKYNELGQVIEKNLHCTNCNDAAVGQSTTQSTAVISRSTYSSGEQSLVATKSIELAPGYDTGTPTQALDARIISYTTTVPGGGTGGTWLQSVDYRYHLRGWLKSINNSQLSNDSGVSNDDTGDYFGMETFYNTDAGNSNTKLYNGNITAVKWKNFGYDPGTPDQRSYKFSYDNADRLTGANFKSVASGVATNDQTGSQDEAATYDANGNILTLTRKQNLRTASGLTYSNSTQTIDNLTYNYASGFGNRISSVEDAATVAGGFANPVTAGTEYKYDTLGNMKVDKNKGIDKIAYNVLGKPDTVHYSDNHWIRYIYDAAGSKLTVKNYNTSGTLTTTTDYVGGFVYVNSALSFFSSPEGRVVKNAGKYEYQYAISDHQGNTRVLFTATAPAPVASRADMETSPNPDFLNSTTNRVNSDLFDHTDVGNDGTDYSQKLTGASGQQVGVARTFHVYPGDKVKIEAYAKYFASSGTSNLTGFATALLSAFALSAPAGGETGTPSAGVNSWGSSVAGGSGKNNTGYPKAFVNLLIFDKNYNYLDLGYDGINGGEQTSDPTKTPHDYMSQEYTIKEEGYVFAYISNENPTLVDVYFDDVVMTHTKSNLIQSSEYYPFAMQTANSWSRENVTGNNFLGNGGTELNAVTSLYDLDYRNYDPILGRMNQLDPMADKFGGLTPFNYSFNSPVVFNDASGAVPGVWSRDIEENATGDFVKRAEYMSFLRASAMITGDGGGGGATWEGAVGNFGLADSGFGMGSLYFEGQMLLSAMNGEENARNWVTVNGEKPKAGVTYHNPDEVKQFVLLENEGDKVGFGGLMYLFQGKITSVAAHKVYAGREGGWVSNSSMSAFETAIDFNNAMSLGGSLNTTPWHFLDGFLNPDAYSNLNPTFSNAVMGYGGVVEIGALNARMTAERAPTWAKYAKELKGLRAWNYLAKGTGALGVVLSLSNAIIEWRLPTAGEVAQASLGAALMLTGPFGLVYLAADIGVGVATRTTITDRIKIGVDYSVSKGR